MAVYDSRLAEVIEALGRYYSIVSKEKFTSILAFGDENTIDKFGNVDLDTTPEVEKLIRVFNDATEGGVIMSKSVEALKDIATGDKDSLNLAMRIYQYVGEPDTFSSIFGDDSYRKVCSPISVRDMCRITPGADGSTDGIINGAFASPTKFTPNLCALQIKNPKLVPATRDSGAAALFMNSIPTLEFSRCQPYLDITLVSPMNGLGDDGRIQTLSLAQHVLGQSQPTSDVDRMLATALDETAIQGRLESEDARRAAGLDAEGKKTSEGSDETSTSDDIDVATVGMEIFTAPQTLVPTLGDQLETYGDFEAFSDVKDEDGNVISAGGRRGAPIIDPFRPLMSIEDFGISVSPSKGMMSHKTADLSLVLHDRSRLTEISEFVKPDLYGRSELMITYGWSHPDDDIAGSGNYYGAFLNALKVTEKYMIVNSSFSFDDVGQVKIKLKLSTKGATNMDTNNISQGEDIEDALQALKDMVDVIKKLKATAIADAKSAGGKDAAKEAKDVFGASFFSAASDTSRAVTMDEETQKALKKYISKNRGAEGTSGELAKTLEDMFGKDGSGGAAANLKKTIADAVAEKMSHLKSMRSSRKDPFAKEVSGNNGSKSYVNIPQWSKDHVSYGALLMYMVGKPLAATKRFDEIQFLFYPMNDKASYLKDLTVAEIPINLKQFDLVFKENTKNSVNLPLGRFMTMVGKEFIHSQTAEAYGLASLYDTDDEGKKQVKEKFKEDPTKLNDEKKKRLEDAYGATSELEFKMPRVSFHIEAVPGKKTGHEEGRRSTILRIHVYDSVCTPHTALSRLSQATRSNSLGLLTSAASKAAREPDLNKEDGIDADISVDHRSSFLEKLQEALDYGLLEAVPSMSEDEASSYDPAEQPDTYFRVKGGFPALKNFIQSTMPSIIYGSTNSAVLSADLSSMNDPKLASINMMRGGMGGGTTAQGVRDAGVPLQTAPVTLSLNTFGCPVISYGQNFFVDFGTGTTIDNTYVVSGIDHTLSKGKFETKIKMTQVDAFGSYTSMVTNITKTITALKDS
jgi:hypothetical protein